MKEAKCKRFVGGSRVFELGFLWGSVAMSQVGCGLGVRSRGFGRFCV